MVGNTIEKVHEETINRRSLVAQRYLPFKVDISTIEPILFGFFQGRLEGGYMDSIQIREIIRFLLQLWKT